MKHLLTLLFALVICLPTQASNSKDEARKQKAQAQELINQAKSAEASGDFATAEAKFKAALAVQPFNGEANKGSQRTHQKHVDALVGDANKLYQASDYKGSVAKLREADQLQPRSPRILESLAASYYHLGDRQSALDYLDQCRDALAPNSPEKPHVDQLRSMVITGENVSLSPEAKAAVVNVDNVLNSKPPNGEEVKDYRNLEAEQETAKCKSLEENEARLPKTGPVIFNLAKCAQEEGRFEDAQRYFAKYLEVAPKSLDAEDVQLRLKDTEPLLAVKGEQGKQLQSLYSEAYRMILVRKYDRALEIYKKADQMVPDYPQTKYKIGLLYQSMGDIPNATNYLRQYMAVENNPDARRGASDIIDSFPASRTEYQRHVIAGKQLLMNGKTQEAIGELSKAGTIFPLGLEVNSLLAQAFLDGNNPQAARNAMDTVFSEGSPVYFYATVTSSAHQDTTSAAGKNANPKSRSFPGRTAKIELEKDKIRVIFLQTLNPAYLEAIQHKKKKGESLPAPYIASSAGSIDDQHARLGGASLPILPDSAPDVFVVPLSQIKEVSTQLNSVEVSFQAAGGSGGGVAIDHLINSGASAYSGRVVTLHFFPQVSAFTPPDAGWPARKFANTYTRMFSQYLGYDGVKLGPEHMSAKEKWMIVAEVALVIASEGQALNSMSKTLTVAFMAVQAFSRIQSRILTDRRLAQTLDFKLIPPDSMELSFRADDFK